MKYKTQIIQAVLFITTLITTTLAGAESMTGRFFFFLSPETILHFPEDFWQGFQFSIPFLAILTCHEFGHYFMARYYKIKVSLPYYIPMWLSAISMSIGTMGAVIRMIGQTRSRKEYFDIGIAGPLAGFVVALFVLYYGFSHLPPLDYIFKIHPEYIKFGEHYKTDVLQFTKFMDGQLVLGDNLLFKFFKKYVADPKLLPPNFEIMHYPVIWAGYLSLFFTALNLIPIGQLDGGHILYGLIGKKNFNIVSPIIFIGFVLFAGYGLLTINDIKNIGTGGQYKDESEFFTWLLGYIFFLRICFSRISENQMTSWALSLGVVFTQFLLSYIPEIATSHGFIGFLPFALFLGKFVGIYHPEVEIDEPLDFKRKLLGWLTLIIFILCFTPYPFMEIDFSAK
ncbi:site-2 protease family protein [Arcicella sp. LKC2W]|uniref:site-2 protease family protein n=1 Tax=Arcicella sp. LKC2W TaxID=2984198 RepID=UPI002B20D83F|nr:site-2 protease family protein [Arcicella sp. LKC2W]MEA5457699.1 site-2 protease family protein [Arcicella sp. LKC2W]